MIYIVSGFMRSGTSMLMDCLSAGGRPNGLRCEWSRERDAAMNARNSDEDFQVNESYREVPLSEYPRLDFPLKYDGCLIKIMSWGLEQMRRTTGFRCVFMLRDPCEIVESYSRSFGRDLEVVKRGVKIPVTELESWPNRHKQEMKRDIIKAETRIDCASLHVFRYADVLADPLSHFRRLADSGWPIDPEIAAAQVRPERKRVTA